MQKGRKKRKEQNAKGDGKKEAEARAPDGSATERGQAAKRQN